MPCHKAPMAPRGRAFHPRLSAASPGSKGVPSSFQCTRVKWPNPALLNTNFSPGYSRHFEKSGRMGHLTLIHQAVRELPKNTFPKRIQRLDMMTAIGDVFDQRCAPFRLRESNQFFGLNPWSRQDRSSEPNSLQSTWVSGTHQSNRQFRIAKIIFGYNRLGFVTKHQRTQATLVIVAPPPHRQPFQILGRDETETPRLHQQRRQMGRRAQSVRHCLGFHRSQISPIPTPTQSPAPVLRVH